MTKSVICTIFLLIAFTLSGCTSDESIKAKHLEKAQSCFDNGEIENAIIELKNAIQIDPEYV